MQAEIRKSDVTELFHNFIGGVYKLADRTKASLHNIIHENMLNYDYGRKIPWNDLVLGVCLDGIRKQMDTTRLVGKIHPALSVGYTYSLEALSNLVIS